MIRVPIGFRVVSALVVVAAFAAGAPARAQVNLIYNAIQPCRLIDTRVMGGPLVSGVARTL